MSRLVNSPDRLWNSASTVAQTVSPRPCRNLVPRVATRSLGRLGDIHDGPGQQGFIANSSRFPEDEVGPCEDRFDVLDGLWR